MEHANVAGSHVLRQDVPKGEEAESRIFVSVESGSNCGKSTSASQGDVHFGEVGLSSSYKYLEDPLAGWDLDVIRRVVRKDTVQCYDWPGPRESGRSELDQKAIQRAIPTRLQAWQSQVSSFVSPKKYVRMPKDLPLERERSARFPPNGILGCRL